MSRRRLPKSCTELIIIDQADLEIKKGSILTTTTGTHSKEISLSTQLTIHGQAKAHLTQIHGSRKTRTY